jgi:FkbM family methyltransferase
VAAGDLVFDVGAHVGDRTAAFAALGARVVAIEPQPSVLPWLKRLVGNRPGVVIEPVAVGAEPGIADLAISEANPTLSTLATEWRADVVARNPTFRSVRWEATTSVPVTTLDDLIEKHGEPIFCKIDVEGHEAEVLRGLHRPLDSLSLEFVRGTTEVGLECVDLLEALAPYRYNAIGGEGRDFIWPEWVDADSVRTWLTGDASRFSSGDLYARRATRDLEERDA